MERNFYFIDEASQKLGIGRNDLIHLAIEGRISLFCKIIRLDVFIEKIAQNDANYTVEKLKGIISCYSEIDREYLENFYFYKDDVIKICHISPKRDKTITIHSGLDWELPEAIYPQDGEFVIDPEDVLIFQSEIDKLKGISKGEDIYQDLPEELKVAVDVFFEFWKDRPSNRNRATKDTITSFIEDRLKEKAKPEAIRRISTIATPEYERKGGAPNSDLKDFKGHSKENQ